MSPKRIGLPDDRPPVGKPVCVCVSYMYRRLIESCVIGALVKAGKIPVGTTGRLEDDFSAKTCDPPSVSYPLPALLRLEARASCDGKDIN